MLCAGQCCWEKDWGGCLGCAQCGRETKKCQGEGGGGEKGSESPTVEHLLLGTN